MNSKFYTVRGYELISKQKMTSSMEDYLEMIYRISLDNNIIRINQLSKLLNVKDSSVSKMVQKLGKAGFLNYEKYKYITLTNKGKKTGFFLLRRHKIIHSFLKLIRSKNILKETELIEHVLDEDTIEKINIINNFFKDKTIFNKYHNYINKKQN